MKQLIRVSTLVLLGFCVIMLQTAPLAAEELRLGGLGPLSGGGATWGLGLQRAVTIAIDEANAKGGLKIEGKTYYPRLIMYDTQYTGQGGTTAALRLVNEDKVKFIIGPVGSPEVLGALGVTGRNKVLVLSCGFSPKILTPASKYNFRICITTQEFALAIGKWMRTQFPKAKTLGVLSPNDAVGQTVTPLVVKGYTSNGFEVAYDEKYERGMTDFSPLITRMISKNVDVFDLDSSAPGEAGLLVKQARQLGYKGIIMQSGGPGIEEVINVAGKLADEFLSFDNFDPKDPLVMPFLDKYRSRWEGPINGLTPAFYNATKILFAAMEKANSVDVEKLVPALESLKGYPTIFGPVKWVGKDSYGIDHQLAVQFLISEVKDGKIVPRATVAP
jgi:branched-chain amino acid transport system substrate-binding protein